MPKIIHKVWTINLHLYTRKIRWSWCSADCWQAAWPATIGRFGTGALFPPTLTPPFSKPHKIHALVCPAQLAVRLVKNYPIQFLASMWIVWPARMVSQWPSMSKLDARVADTVGVPIPTNIPNSIRLTAGRAMLWYQNVSLVLPTNGQLLIVLNVNQGTTSNQAICLELVFNAF